MSLLFHLVHKDFRHSWRVLAVWCLILLVSIAWDTQIELWLGESEESTTVPTNTPLALMILSVVGGLIAAADLVIRAAIVSKLVHEDAAVGSGEFWMSRPVSAGTLFAGKTICLVLALVLPPIVLVPSVKGLLTGVFTLSVLDVLTQGFLVASLMTLATLTPSLARMVVLGGTLALAGIGQFFVFVWLVGPEVWLVAAPALAGMNLPGWRALSLPALFFIVACGATTWHQYLTRRTRRSVIAAFCVTPASLLVLWAAWFPYIYAYR